jgi:hypothetical protein
MILHHPAQGGIESELPAALIPPIETAPLRLNNDRWLTDSGPWRKCAAPTSLVDAAPNKHGIRFSVSGLITRGKHLLDDRVIVPGARSATCPPGRGGARI